MKKTFFTLTTFCLLNALQSNCSDGGIPIPSQEQFTRANDRAFTMQLKALHDGDLDPNKQLHSGGTFLHCATIDIAKTGSPVGLHFLKALIAKKADLNATATFSLNGKQKKTGTALQLAQAMLKNQPTCTSIATIITILKQAAQS